MIGMPGLRVAVAIADAGGIRAAAERLGRSPSAVSMMLRQMEAELGAALFEGGRRAHPTRLGQQVLNEARDVIAHFDRAAAAIRAFAGTEAGQCDIACVPSVAVAFMPAAILKLRATAPLLAVQVRDMDSRAAVEAVAKGAVDAAFASLSRPTPDLSLMPVLADRLDVVCRADDRLARVKHPLPWRALLGRRFLANGSYGGVVNPEFLATARAAHLQVRNVTSLLAMVRVGVGITVLPRLCRLQGEAGLCFVPVEDPEAVRVLSLITRAGRAQPPGSMRLASAVLEVARARETELSYKLLLAPEASPGDIA